MEKALQNDMKTGDMLAWQGRNPWGYIIRTVTESPVNHCSIVRTEKTGQIWNYESELLQGVHGQPLQQDLDGYHGRVWLYRLKKEFAFIRDDIELFMLSKCGAKTRTPYDYFSLIGQLWGQVTCDPDAFFCSEYVFWVTRAAMEKNGMDVDFDHAPNPGELTRFDWYLPPVLIYSA